MQDVSADWLNALKGSFQPDVQVDAWYDGDLVYEGLPVEGGQVTLDRTRAIAGDLSLEAASPDELLVPTSWNSPLAPYGSVLNVRAGIRYGFDRGESVSLGWYRIDASDPKERWVPYQDGDLSRAPLMVCQGALVSVDASDLMSLLDDARFVVPEAPASLTSVKTEITRLVRDYVPVDDLSAIADAAIPRSITYETSRVEALQALADVLSCWIRMSPGGGFTLVPKTPDPDPVWTVSIGTTGTITEFGRKLVRDGLRNGVVSKGQAADGTPVQGVAVEESGPLRWGGPLGTIAEEHSSNLLTTAAAAQADAEARLARLIRERVAPISVTCVANPALELDDTVALELPDRTLIGQVAQMTIPLPATTMSMVVMVPRAQLWGA
jgi:hypothetical protein